MLRPRRVLRQVRSGNRLQCNYIGIVVWKHLYYYCGFQIWKEAKDHQLVRGEYGDCKSCHYHCIHAETDPNVFNWFCLARRGRLWLRSMQNCSIPSHSSNYRLSFDSVDFEFGHLLRRSISFEKSLHKESSKICDLSCMGFSCYRPSAILHSPAYQDFERKTHLQFQSYRSV